MGISTPAGQLTSEEIVALSREHTFFSWSAQGAIDPIAIDRAEGVYLYTRPKAAGSSTSTAS